MSKKTENISFRLTPEYKDQLNVIAENMGLNANSFSRAIITQYLNAHKIHGNNLLWPVEFPYKEYNVAGSTHKTSSKKKHIAPDNSRFEPISRF